jgi:hypothetical protein
VSTDGEVASYSASRVAPIQLLFTEPLASRGRSYSYRA